MSKSTTPRTPSSVIVDGENQDQNQEPNKDNKNHLSWTDQIESLLSGWADTAAVYKWLHDKSHRKYKRKNKFLAIPTMILSLITGSLGIGLQGYVPAEYMSIGQGALGGMGVFIGILQGLQTQFGFAQRSEKHSGSCLGWGKLQRNIQIELSIEREYRKEADSFVKVCRMEYDRLTEQSPPIPSDVLEMFKIIFKKQADDKKKQEEEELILPDICDSIKHTKVYKAAINNPDSLMQNVYNIDKKDDPQKQETENIVKQALNERIKELDEKMSGITQFKLASMGNRFAPIVNHITSHIEHERIHTPHNKHHIEHVENNIVSRPRKNTDFQGIIEHRKSFSNNRPILGLPVDKKPPIDLGVVRPNVKNLINKFSMKPPMEVIGENNHTEVIEEKLPNETKPDDVVKIDIKPEEDNKPEKLEVSSPVIPQEEPLNNINTIEISNIPSTTGNTPTMTPTMTPVISDTKESQLEIPKLNLEVVKKEEEERQNNSNSKRKKSSGKKNVKEPVFIFKDEN